MRFQLQESRSLLQSDTPAFTGQKYIITSDFMALVLGVKVAKQLKCLWFHVGRLEHTVPAPEGQVSYLA